jgi:threonine/homoserine/homoserine lactone efflux protein
VFETTTLVAFFVASAAIILVPGPAQAMVVARTLSEGRRAGVLTAVGLNIGTIVHAVAAGLGVTAVLATSATAFATVKFAGAGYLIYLGIQAWRTGERSHPGQPAPRHSLGRAVVTGILNPKVALFFLAFLPQFTDPARGSVFLQCLVLGGILAAIDSVYESALAVLASTIRDTMRSQRFQRWQNRTTGAVLVGLGGKLALAQRR